MTGVLANGSFTDALPIYVSTVGCLAKFVSNMAADPAFPLPNQHLLWQPLPVCLLVYSLTLRDAIQGLLS